MEKEKKEILQNIINKLVKEWSEITKERLFNHTADIYRRETKAILDLGDYTATLKEMNLRKYIRTV